MYYCMELTCVIAAGGLGKRLQGFRDNDKTKVLLEVNNIPMICQQIKQINSWGLDRFIIITNPTFHSLIEDITLSHFPNLNLDFVVQEEAKGISHALYQAKPYCENLEGKFLFVLGDNFFGENPLSAISSSDLLNNKGCQIYTVEVENPTEYGVAVVDDYSNVIEIEEKPLDPKSNLAVVGIYLFDSNAFKFIDELQPSARGEYEITDLINIYIKKEICTHSELSSWWIDAGTPDRIEELETKLL